MKILVLSDSHLYNDYLQKVTQKYKNHVDLMVHCGDSSLKKSDPIMQEYSIAVLGNHDYDTYPQYQIYQNICVTHGHLYHVYGGYEELITLCQQNQCQICFHGHTHVPTHQIYQGIHFINPGSLMMNRGSYAFGTYAIVDLEESSINVTYYHHENHEVVDSSLILNEGLQLLEDFKQIIKKQGY